jgi:hypothetical protein
MLDVILYSREQILKELEAMPGKGNPDDIPDVPWGIISIKAQDEDFETPMQPITMMRNALGREEGGSGVPLDKVKYDASVECASLSPTCRSWHLRKPHCTVLPSADRVCTAATKHTQAVMLECSLRSHFLLPALMV